MARCRNHKPQMGVRVNRKGFKVHGVTISSVCPNCGRGGAYTSFKGD